LLTFGAAGLAQQQTTRRSTNLAALLNYPAFFQLRPVLVVGTLSLEDNGRVKLTDETGSVSIVSRGNQPDGLVEVRGEFWDIGRMNQDDPRLLNLDVRRTFGIDPEAPGHGRDRCSLSARAPSRRRRRPRCRRSAISCSSLTYRIRK
jgi:hypothetical protein